MFYARSSFGAIGFHPKAKSHMELRLSMFNERYYYRVIGFHPEATNSIWSLYYQNLMKDFSSGYWSSPEVTTVVYENTMVLRNSIWPSVLIGP